ncbi:hypothetical protein PV735_42480 [Streptomyces turgidiscabies]|uniref:Uncharacterized protein n=1 Tax=Streptomyces turgidiscabies (strain Car8) TaxID=698760 RepID=L7F428_STRT8|nr:hypothetical protein [Streptomyces turgidiscabies]ELP66353.1 hypothetical protein STRTUCAR8_01467 [Streptomyces turgidiscabies Car8]MDX3499316.1 hypothetical protein [Streptomyces turgidiscabies]GAQ75849.1 hypothetical protein T45_07637 [Streptomyces turgidiscabies]
MGILGTATGSRRKERKKKPDELLASVVRETAIPAAVELLRSNTQFVFPSGTAWVMLVLAADSIGGLNKRHGRDEAKGSIIELISSDQIRTVATAEMLEEEVFGIIPTDETLARMEEYSLLTGATYAWAVVWQKPSGDLLVDLVNDATFAQARFVAAGTTSLEEAVGKEAWEEHSGLVAEAGATAPAVLGEDEGDAIFDGIPGDEGAAEGLDDEPLFSDVVDADEGADAPMLGEDAAGIDDAGAVPVESEPDYDGDEVAGYEGFDETDAGYGVEGDYQEAGDTVLLADQAQVRDTIARRFLSEELDLDVRLDEFNATFAIGAPVVQIAVPEGATEWLGDQVAQLNRQANADLMQLRSAHEDELRALYVNLMSAHTEQVIRDVATDRAGSRYKLLKDAAEAEHQQRQTEKDEKIRARRAEIAKDYESQASKVAQQAALSAELQYKERNRSKMEREQTDSIAGIERDIEDTHAHNQQEILRVRRSDATLKMQTGQTRIFEVLAERQSKYLAAEEERLNQWKSEIQRIVDDNRKADIAQSEALAEHLRTTDEIGALRREQQDLLESVRSEHADRIRRMEEELERNRKDAITQMTARDAEWQHNLDLEKEKTNSQVARVTDLLQQLSTVEDSVARRYEVRLAEMQADKESYANELARASEMQSRSNKILVVMIVTLSLLMGAAGFIVGVVLIR